MGMEAGKGDHKVYHVNVGEPDGEVLRRGIHYVGIDAVAWFINKQSGWFEDRMGSGTLSLRLAGGREKYEAALGTYELDGGARYAPVFENPVLPDRNYLGGNILINASLSGIARDTVLSSILKSAADTSLGIVAGMIETATLAGPQKILGAAGGSLVGSVQDILQNKAEEREPMFDFSGITYGVRADDVTTPISYVLLHRGSALDEDKLTVAPDGALLLPMYDGRALTDGAWLLLRIRRTREYSGTRPWFIDQRRFRNQIRDLVSDVDLGAIDSDTALEQFRPSDRGDSTLYDEYVRLRAVINNDGVITNTQAGVFKAQLKKALMDARTAIEQGVPEDYHREVGALRGAIGDGELPEDMQEMVKAEVDGVSVARGGEPVELASVGMDHLVPVMPATFDLSLSAG